MPLASSSAPGAGASAALSPVGAQVDGIVVSAHDDALFRFGGAGQHRDDAGDVRGALLLDIVRDFEPRAVAVKLREDPAARGSDATGLLIRVRVIPARLKAGESLHAGANAIRRDFRNYFLDRRVGRRGLRRQSGRDQQQP